MVPASRALRRHRNRLLHLDQVVGVGLGRKEVGGTPSEELALCVLVRQKLPRHRLAAASIVPQRLDGWPTDVIEVGALTMLAERTNRQRPAHPGVSIGHYRVTAGTLGAIVRDRRSGGPLILSNNHVLANITDGRDGRAARGDPVLQPGHYDGGTESDVIGRLERFVSLYREADAPVCPIARAAERWGNRWLARLAPGYEFRLVRRTGRENQADAAVAAPTNSGDVAPEILGIGPVRGLRQPELGLNVMKSGRTSGVTRGVVRLVEATVRVMMGEVGSAVFNQQLITTPMAEPGDSGSLVLTEAAEAVGLLSAGSDLATVAAPIHVVSDLLEVDLVTV